MYCFTRKTLGGANRITKHLSGVKQIALRVKQKYYYIVLHCFTRKVNFLRVKTSVLRVKYWKNDPFGHKLQITLIHLLTFYT